MEINSLKSQHEELLTLVSEISPHLNVETLSDDAWVIKTLLAKFKEKLNLLLTMEYSGFNPAQMENSDKSYRNHVKKDLAEESNIVKIFKKYKTKWTLSSEISYAPQDFIKETRAIFQKLA